jgi:hypothetical protein
MRQPLAHSVHRIADLLQTVLGHLELLLVHYDHALTATKDTIPELRRMAAEVETFRVMLPASGAVVVPHGAPVVYPEDVTERVDPGEVRVVHASQLKSGRGKRTRKTA